MLAVVSPRRLRITWREVPFLAVFGVVGVALTQYLYYVAIGLMPVGIALVFEMTAPVFIALYVWLVRHEKVRSRLWAALLLSLSGLVLVAEVWQDGGSLKPLGVGAALVAALCLATYYLMGERGTVTRDPVTLTCWSFVAAAVFWSVAAPWWQFDAGLLGERGAGVDRARWSCRSGCSSPGSSSSGPIVPFWLSIAGLRHLAPTAAGLVATDRAGVRLDRRLALAGAGAQRLADRRRARRPHRHRAGADGAGRARAHAAAGDAGRAVQLAGP